MKIAWKMYLSLGLILSFLILTILPTYHHFNMVEFYRARAAASQHELLVTTDLRAIVRHRFLEFYEVLVNATNHDATSLDLAEKDADEKLAIVREVVDNPAQLANVEAS